ncbi:hypothetical protein [Nocardia cyriacigeorgica]|uniref:hypothetical protein n=1 Tax=Nocardia cyriacigeorgica TaxID=135487 RepID=UPI00245674CF|nr:hypothetical protein [Nocardia cyriacigeorgica]
MDAGNFLGGRVGVSDIQGEGALARLVRAATGLSEESQRYLAMIADRLRVSEGLPLFDDAGDLRECGDGPARTADADGRAVPRQDHAGD